MHIECFSDVCIFVFLWIINEKLFLFLKDGEP